MKVSRNIKNSKIMWKVANINSATSCVLNIYNKNSFCPNERNTRNNEFSKVICTARQQNAV